MIRLLIFCSVILSSCYSQYVFGKGLYLGGEISYNKNYLTEKKQDNNSRYEGEGTSYKISITYAFNYYNYLSLEYIKSGTEIIHSSPFFIYSEQNSIPKTKSKISLEAYQLTYLHVFHSTNIFISIGIRTMHNNAPTTSVFYRKYINQIAGNMVIGYRYLLSDYTFFMPYFSYVSYLTNLRNNENQNISLSQVQFGVKLWFNVL